MEKIYGNSDCLTNLNNENFLRGAYQGYLDNYANANFLMIDFKKFKSINDNYGHDIGDKYLIVFARVLTSVFDDSLVIRLHGDEFCVLTKYSEEEIAKRIGYCNRKIEMTAESGAIPDKFEFNVGVAPAEHGIDSTRAKADYMMYYAKKKGSNVQFFDQDIWNIKINEDNFIDNVTNNLANDSFSYYQREIHNIDSKDIVMNEILTRDSNGIAIFSDKNYSVLRNNQLLKKIDIHNIEYLSSNIAKNVDGKVLLNIDYKTLLYKKDLIDYIKLLIDINKINPVNIVLSINVSGMQNELIDDLLPIIRAIRLLDFEICLDKYSSMMGDKIWENAYIDYIKYDTNYWKESMLNSRQETLLRARVRFFSEYSAITSIFSYTTSKEEYDYLLSLNNKVNNQDSVLASGNYMSKEYKIKIK